ncbi:MAG: hypothetical protein PHS63_01640 [Desulfoplanes sp.]|nr:hypothetical protein [Desulfoplanes sp.]
MKYFPFRLLIVCILLPPLLYIISLQALESGLERKYSADLTSIYLGDTTALLNGKIRLRDMVGQNINAYFIRKHAQYWGIKPDVLVTTHDNEIIYPASFDDDASLNPRDSLDIANANYALMNKGLRLSVNLSLSPGSPAGLSLLALYVIVDIALLFLGYKRGLERALREEARKDSRIQELRDKEQQFSQRIAELGAVREKLESKVHNVKSELENEREKASANEDGMLDEIVTLEKELEDTLLRQEEQLDEIQKLRDQIEDLSLKPAKKSQKKVKVSENLEKRLRVLYKNLEIHTRSIQGITDLAEDMRIKAEEVILQLNMDPSLVTVKRKVFGKGGKTKVLEIAFGYNGRLYYRHNEAGRIEVLCVGTKNSQAKDLDFLDRV